MRKIISSVGRHVLLIVVSFAILLPVFWLVECSIKSRQDVLEIPVKWIPTKVHLINFVEIFNQLPYSRYFMNSVAITSVAIISNVLLCSMAGYALAKFKIPGRRILLLVILSTGMVQLAAVLIPLYTIALRLHLLNTYIGLMLPWFVNGYGVLIMRQSIITIPDALIESARIDGASELTIFFRIIIPLAKPGLVSTAIFVYVSTWNEFIWPLVIADSEKLFTLPVGIAYFQTSYYQQWNLFMAAALLAILPSIIIFSRFQRQYMKSLALSGIKE